MGFLEVNLMIHCDSMRFFEVILTFLSEFFNDSSMILQDSWVDSGGRRSRISSEPNRSIRSDPMVKYRFRKPTQPKGERKEHEAKMGSGAASFAYRACSFSFFPSFLPAETTTAQTDMLISSGNIQR